jgi:hypothetical protein
VTSRDSSERRRGADRRRHSRGGRRPGDRAGHAPLVFVVSRDPNQLAFWEAQLLARQFAVIACKGPAPARDAFRALRPDVIVAAAADYHSLHDQLRFGRRGHAVPIVELSGTPEPTEQLLGRIRRALEPTVAVSAS